MKYLLCLGFPLLVQVIVTFIASQAGSGGSFAGLGALLFTLLGIPLTLIINFAWMRSNPQAGLLAHFSRSLLPDSAGAADRVIDRSVGVSPLTAVQCPRRLELRPHSIYRSWLHGYAEGRHETRR